MTVINETLTFSTRGRCDLINITEHVADVLTRSGIRQGTVTVFVVGSTAGITTFEYEPGLIKDMTDLYEKIAPSKSSYSHDATWGDANGFSHIRAAFTGPSLTIPFEDGSMYLGTWQQIVLADFDNRPRNRSIVVNIIGS
ncbi:MAG: YjbQ family protein [Nitrospirae bacterium]|nr:YjbQ family protein [Nitrospirota bacterium]